MAAEAQPEPAAPPVPEVIAGQEDVEPVAAVISEPIADQALADLLRMQVTRLSNGKPALLACSWVGSKKAWRWQCRTKPCLNGNETRDASTALAGWLRKHRGSITEDSAVQVEERQQRLSGLIAELNQQALLGRFSRRRPQPPSLPSQQFQAGGPLNFEELTLPDLELLLQTPVRTERHLPAWCLHVVGTLVADLAKEALQSHLAAALLVILPKLIWHSTWSMDGNRRPRGHQRQRIH